MNKDLYHFVNFMMIMIDCTLVWAWIEVWMVPREVLRCQTERYLRVLVLITVLIIGVTMTLIINGLAWSS